MRFRYTTQELQEWTDNELLLRLVIERQSDCTNVYSSLHKRLDNVKCNLDRAIKKDKGLIEAPK